MKYSSDFDSKWGFGDGDSMPPDAHQVRTVNLYAVNSLLAATGSNYRLVPLDRGGCHNCWLWCRRPLDEVRDIIERVGLWDFCLGEWNSQKKFVIPDACWRDDAEVAAGGTEYVRWWRVVGICSGDGSLAGCDEAVGAAFVNSRNQIRKAALERWVCRTARALREEMSNG